MSDIVDNTYIFSSIKNNVSNNKSIFILLFCIYFTYAIINYLLQVFRYISFPILFSIILIKIGLYSLSDNIENNNTYNGILLRQTFVVMFIQTIIYFLNIIESIPIINILPIFNYMSFLLILVSYLVLLPTGIVNIIFKKLATKIYFLNADILLNEPLSDKLVNWIKDVRGDNTDMLNKLNNTVYNYDNKDIKEMDIQFITNIIDIVSKKIEHYNADSIKKLYSDTKIELKKLINYLIKLIINNSD